MRIAIFSDTLFPQINGVAYGVFHSAEFLSKQGHEVVVVTAMNKENKIRLKDKHNFQIIFSVSIPAGVYPGERVALPFDPKVLIKMKKFKPDVIHTHTPFGVGWSAVFAAKKLKVPLVGTHHTFYDHYLKHVRLDHSFGRKLSWKYTVLYYNFCDLVLCPSLSLAEELIKNGLKKPTKIFRNAIDTNFFVPAESEVKKILKKKFGLSDFSAVYVGRLSYEKSVDVVLRAMSIVQKENNKIHLLVGGDGPERANLEKLARTLGIENQVKFIGFVRGQEWLEVFQSADVFITASKSENMPLTILEAMSAGLPVVAVGEKGVLEIVENNENGLLSKADDVENLARNILKLEKDNELRREMSLASRKLSSEYSYEAIGKELVNIYSGVVQPKHTSPKICLYLEYLHFRNGILYKDVGTGLLSSYKNQKKMLESLGLEYTEKWEDDCDILQINTPWLKSIYLIKKARRMGKPVIICSHVTAEDIRGVFRGSFIFSPIMKYYLTYAYNLADIILSPTEYTRGLVTAYGISPKKVLIQSNGVALDKYYKNEVKRVDGRKAYALSDTVVGTVGAAIPRKGIDTFLLLANKFTQNSFVWFGTIYGAAMVQALPKTLPANVRFTGYVPDILEAFNTLDIFIFPSYEENQGMVILEAAAIGLPILVRDIPVYRGWLVDGENCLKAKDEADFIVKLGRLIEDKDLRAKLSRGALELAKHESLETLSNRLEQIYKGLLV